MSSFTLSDYGPNPNAGKDRNNAAQRGWGPGWRDCQTGAWRVVERAGVKVVARKEIAPLVAALFTATERMGYDIRDGQTWGAACRAIRGTNTASNHSWALAFDINSLSNPMASSFQSDIPPKVVRMWEECGFYWGGRYTGRVDTMHFEYIGRPADIDRHLRIARSYLDKPPREPGHAGGGRRGLRRGSTGDAVRELQRVLNSWYPKLTKLEVDGVFGELTEERVRYFQDKAGLPVTGSVTDKERTKLGLD